MGCSLISSHLKSQETRPIFFYILSIYSSVFVYSPLLLRLVVCYLCFLSNLAFLSRNLWVILLYLLIPDVILDIVLALGHWRSSNRPGLYSSLISVFQWYSLLRSLTHLLIWLKNGSASDQNLKNIYMCNFLMSLVFWSVLNLYM